ncbi:hypothetical protein [Archaeoglobus sp. UBA230]|jgi:predicted CopG family antitoxin|nr:hypothetical protein [Archaeoglobus sp. UBA230]
MGWKSISIADRTYKKLEKLKQKFKETTGRDYSMNDVIMKLLELAGR